MDFIRHMKPSKYESRAAFEHARAAIRMMPPAQFGKFMKAVAADDEGAV